MTKQDEWLKVGGFEEGLQRAQQAGANLTTAQIELLREAAWQYHRKSERQQPRAMNPNFRARKSDLLKHLREGLENLRALRLIYLEGWFKKKDLSKVLDRDAIVEVVSLCAFHFGHEYGDAILRALKTAYANENEEIVIQRSLETFRPGLRR
jgi:hypothetical protein